MTLYQPPVHSPVTVGAIVQSCLAALRDPEEGFEAALQDRLKADFMAEEVALFGSGTHALEAAIRIASRGKGGGHRKRPLVALPGYTCFDVATAAVGADVEVTFYDIDPETLSPDLASVQAALAQGAGVLVVTLLYGFPVDWDGLNALAQEHGCVVIEDAAQAAGASWKGSRCGSLGPLSVLSFGRGKGWGGGGGGALMARGPLADHLAQGGEWTPRGARPIGGASAAKSLAQWALGRPGLYGVPARIPVLGLGETVCRDPSPIRPIQRYQAAIALHSAEPAEAEVGVRRTVAGLLRRELDSVLHELSPVPVHLIDPVAGGEPGYLRLPVLLAARPGALDDPGRARRLGIAPGYPKPLDEVPALAGRRGGTKLSLSGALRLSQELITLPAHRFVTKNVRRAIASMIQGQGTAEAVAH